MQISHVSQRVQPRMLYLFATTHAPRLEPWTVFRMAGVGGWLHPIDELNFPYYCSGAPSSHLLSPGSKCFRYDLCGDLLLVRSNPSLRCVIV